MGVYYPSRGSPESKGWSDYLSKHIRYLKQYPGYSSPLGKSLALIMQSRYPELLKMDLIVPVPSHNTELKMAKDRQGFLYNQAIELTKVVSNETGIPYQEALAKTRAQKQRELRWNAKWELLKGLYETSDRAEVTNKEIILIDDVSTSGATASECSKVLIDSGARAVNVLVAGRDSASNGD